LSESISGKHAETVTKEYSLTAKKVTITADDMITINTGSASIQMKKNGDITIEGKTINIKGSGNVIIKGQKILEN
jgi:type VI secretion system secreted protein VgrG